MATERVRRMLAGAALGALAVLLLLPLPASAAASPAPAAPTPRPVPASEPWWLPVGFAGHTVRAVRAGNGTIAVALDGGAQQESSDGGRTWHAIFERHGLVIPPRSPWRAVDNHVGHADAQGTVQVEPDSPAAQSSSGGTGADARGLIAAPASLPGVVVAVDVDNVVWRRDAAGHWARALLLLPQGLTAGPPRITSLVAFDTAPLSDTVYMGTDGYSVLISTDGGEDWRRAGPGLPDQVYALDTDPTEQAVYAGTSDGLFVHHLRALPAPPVYPDAALRWRWLGVALVTLAATAAAAAGMLRLLR